MRSRTTNPIEQGRAPRPGRGRRIRRDPGLTRAAVQALGLAYTDDCDDLDDDEAALNHFMRREPDDAFEDDDDDERNDEDERAEDERDDEEEEFSR